MVVRNTNTRMIGIIILDHFNPSIFTYSFERFLDFLDINFLCLRFEHILHYLICFHTMQLVSMNIKWLNVYMVCLKAFNLSLGN